MARWSPARADVIAAHAREVLALFPRGRILLGVDGVDGAGKSTFARESTAAFRSAGVASAVVSMDDFQSAPSVRGGPSSADGWYAHGFDHALLRRRVVEPFRRGEPVQLVGRALDAEEPTVDPPTLDPGERAVLVVEGIFLHRPELAPLWHTSAWLDAPLDVAFARCVERDGWDPAPDAALSAVFFAAERQYLRSIDPRRRANATFDLTDPVHPRRVFADAC